MQTWGLFPIRNKNSTILFYSSKDFEKKFKKPKISATKCEKKIIFLTEVQGMKICQIQKLFLFRVCSTHSVSRKVEKSTITCVISPGGDWVPVVRIAWNKKHEYG